MFEINTVWIPSIPGTRNAFSSISFGLVRTRINQNLSKYVAPNVDIIILTSLASFSYLGLRQNFFFSISSTKWSSKYSFFLKGLFLHIISTRISATQKIMAETSFRAGAEKRSKRNMFRAVGPKSCIFLEKTPFGTFVRAEGPLEGGFFLQVRSNDCLFWVVLIAVFSSFGNNCYLPVVIRGLLGEYADSYADEHAGKHHKSAGYPDEDSLDAALFLQVRTSESKWRQGQRQTTSRYRQEGQNSAG